MPKFETRYRDYAKPRRGVRSRVLSGSVVEDRGFTTPCRIWQGRKDRNGYGRIKRKGVEVPVHWILKGDPPEGLEIDHLCRQRDCIEPDHLEYVTRDENLRRRGS